MAMLFDTAYNKINYVQLEGYRRRRYDLDAQSGSHNQQHQSDVFASGFGERQVEERQDGSNSAAGPGPGFSSSEENLRAKLPNYEDLFSTPSSRIPAPVYTPASSHIVTSSPTSIENDAVAQLRCCNPPSPSPSTVTGPKHSHSTPISHTSASDSSETVYDSDRSDFLEFPETPCPTRLTEGNSKNSTKRATGRTSHHFPKTAVSKRNESVRRRLDFGAPKTPKTLSALQNSAKMVRAPEYSPTRKWTYEEHEFLCVLWRWYRRDLRSFAQVFNQRFGLNLEQSRVTTRFENHLRLHGPRAFRVYDSVFSVPFNDETDKYGAVRRRIESIADSNSIKLVRLDVEIVSPSGKARTAKSRQTRQTYKALVKKAREEERCESRQLRTKEKTQITTPLFGRVPIRTEAEFDLLEYVTEEEDNPFSSITSTDASAISLFNTDAVPALAFRVWDEGSRAKFDDKNGFVSEGFRLWRGDLPPPPPGDFIDLLLNNHMSMSSGGTSFWVSVTTSLLQAFSKAANMVQPHLAIIALNHPTLLAEGKVLHAKQVLSRLKARGQASWARKYKGWAEFLVFGRVERASIIHTLPLADLIRLYDHSSSVRDLLSLEIFTPRQRTMAISEQLSEKGITLNASVGEAIAKLVLLMLGPNPTYGLHHIETFVCCVVESWVVLERTSQDTASASYAFAATFGPFLHEKEDLVGAFSRGVRKGIGTIQFFAKLRTRRRRTT